MELTKEQKILQQVFSEAWNNPSYKQELMANPTDAIKRLTGERFSLPEGKTLAVSDQSDSDKVYLSIPPKPNYEDVELTDHELEVVAGGGCIPGYIIGIPNPFNPPICTYPGGGGTTPIFKSSPLAS